MTKLPEGSFSIRPAVSQDLDAVASIDALCFPPGIAYPREEIAFLLLNPTVITLVAEHSGVMIGLAALERRRRSREAPRYGELVTIEVLPEHRRESIGASLYRRLETGLREWGGSSVHLHVSVENADALAFYQRLGFSVVDRVPKYYLRKVDAWRMQKELL
ncbi:MAG TPA: N-acetyltransferase [Acidobacteriaceae bacterium]|nr:N-acetyltransferase [Acidobacteriaceae bacterium]